MLEFEIGEEVELAPGFDHLYNPDIRNGFKGVFVGCRAIIKDRRKDGDGFPHVFVEWKKDWRYNGMADGWTFATHFRRIEKSLLSPQDNADLIIKDMIDTAKARVEEEQDICPGCGESHGDVQATYVEKALKAEHNIVEADGFIAISVHPVPVEDDDEYIYYVGEIVQAALDPMAIEAVEEQIINLAAQIIVDRANGYEA